MPDSVTDFDPTLIAFVCNWCTYTAADLAGTARLAYPQNVRLIRVMCTGMVDPQFVLKAFLEGADGVLISGCHPGDCHYINGNYKARRRVKLLRELLTHFSIAPQRLRLTWIGASDGIQFAEVMQRLVNDLKALGPQGVASEHASWRPQNRRLQRDAIGSGSEVIGRKP
ncbi:MAG: hydrogenase iron-sulfur subunit [Desulfosarcinaceae bacterium]|nr:hydrogenase iron-sulfur subunit [Desulfosarcinaceae bacterium]